MDDNGALALGPVLAKTAATLVILGRYLSCELEMTLGHGATTTSRI